MVNIQINIKDRFSPIKAFKICEPGESRNYNIVGRAFQCM